MTMMNLQLTLKEFLSLVLGWILLCLVCQSNVWAEEPSPQPAAAPATSAEEADVSAIKEKYWARGDESELGVVQNRTYSKTKRIEFSLFYGFVTSDPFLQINSLGGSVGYNFSEYLSLSLIGWNYSVAPSAALGATTNNNPPKYYVGSELSASLLYGKLSLMGKKIIYYDFHLTAGAGETSTLNGNYFTPSVGIGQRVYLSKKTFLRVGYQVQRYNEQIIERVITPKLGQLVGERVNWNNSILIGVGFMFGASEELKK